MGGNPSAAGVSCGPSMRKLKAVAHDIDVQDRGGSGSQEVSAAVMAERERDARPALAQVAAQRETTQQATKEEAQPAAPDTATVKFSSTTAAWEPSGTRRGGRPPAEAIHGEKVRELRDPLTQAKFAEKTDLSTDVIQKAENGKATKETMDELCRFAKKKGVEMTPDLLRLHPQLDPPAC